MPLGEKNNYGEDKRMLACGICISLNIENLLSLDLHDDTEL